MEQYLDLDASKTLVEAAMLSGLMPVDGNGFVMLSNGNQAIFVPSGKELSFAQKLIAVKTLASLNRLDSSMFVADAVNDPTRVDNVVDHLYSSVVGRYRQAYNASERNGQRIASAVKTISQNNSRLATVAMRAGFSEEDSLSMASDVSATLESIGVMLEDGTAPGR